jgi:PKD repeat protein
MHGTAAAVAFLLLVSAGGLLSISFGAGSLAAPTLGHVPLAGSVPPFVAGPAGAASSPWRSGGSGTDRSLVGGTSFAASTSVGNWTNLTSNLTTSPTPRSGVALAYDPAARYSVLFGGSTVYGHHFNDTWSFRNGSWTNLTSSLKTSPPRVGYASMTFDPHVGGLVLFGGDNGAGAGTWTFVNGTWKNLKLAAAASPPGLVTPLLVYDARDGYTLLFGGGIGGVGTNETWKFANLTWTNLTSRVHGSPPPMVGGGGDFDAGLDAVLLYIPQYTGLVGGTSQSWEYVNLTWTELSSTATPESHYYPAIAATETSRGTLLFGGNDEFYGIPLNSTWLFLNGNWTNETVSVASVPSDRSGCSATFDRATDSVLLFGGYSSAQTLDLSDTWLYTTHAAPSVRATVTPGSAEVHEPVAFAATPYGNGTGPYSYAWSFGDGTTASGENVSHAYGRPGSFTARVVIADRWGDSNSSAVVVPVLPDPTVTIAPSIPAGEVSVPVRFSSAVTKGFPPFQFAWSFGDEWSSTLAAPTHTYTSAGNFPVRLTVTDAVGITANASVVLRVASGLVVVATTLDDPGDAGLPILFNATVLDGIPPFTVGWVFGDGTNTSGVGPVHTYARAGNYSVRLTVTDAVGVQRGSEFIERINPSLTVDLSANVTASDPGVPVQFLATPSGGTAPYSVHWAFGDAAVATDVGPAHAYGRVGSYPVQLTATDSLGQTATRSVVVAVNPLPSVRATADLLQPVPGEVVTFTAHLAGGTAPLSVQWQFGDGFGDFGAVVNHSYRTNATFTATATVTDLVGQSAVAPVRVTVLSPPAPAGGGSSTPAAGGGSTSWIVGGGLAGAVAIAAAVTLLWRSRRARSTAPSVAEDSTVEGDGPAPIPANTTALDDSEAPVTGER